MLTPPLAETPLTSHLDPGERLLWHGRPRGGVRLRRQDAFLVPFSLAWCGFILFWEYGAYTSHAPTVMPLFGLPFVCIGLYLIFGRFFVDALGRSRTFYGVTGDRIIIVSGIVSQQTKSLPLRTLSDISLALRRDGSGCITFGPNHMMAAFAPAAGTWPGMAAYAAPSFSLIESAKEVYDLIRNAQKKQNAAP